MSKKKGFTLIELLVVVAIIGLLAAMSVIALNSARAKARDSRRLGDVKQIQTALELYFNENSAYPPTNGVVAGQPIASGTVFMSKVPNNPRPVDNTPTCPNVDVYTYTQTGTNGSSYTLTYCLGGPTGGAPAGAATATPAGIR